jgi:glycosyltransferase involved in cell wall biosynthesis
LLGCHIDRPLPGTLVDGNAIDTWGWALSRGAAVWAIEFTDSDRLLRRVPANVSRPDVRDAFPRVLDAERTGFRTFIPLEGRAGEFRIDVRALLADGTRASLGQIIAQRRWRESDPMVNGRLASVIIPCYQQAHYLSEAIESALAQTHPHVEVVVIDDGSPDNTIETANRYPGVRCITQDNLGLPAARNTGIRRSNGSFLVFLDADDRLLPTAIEAGLASLDAHPEAAFTSGRCRWIATDGSPLPTPEGAAADGDLYAALLRSNYVGMPATAMYRRGVFEVVHGFRTATPLQAAADYDLNLRIAGRFPICAHPQVVAEYRQRDASMSRDPALMLRSVLAAIKAQRPLIGPSRTHRAAYRAGLRFWRNYYGRPLAHHAAGYVQRGQWGRALAATWVLLRFHPTGLADLLRGGAPLD